MTNHQIAKQKIIRAALATLLEKKALWENLTGMKKDVDALTAVREEIEAGIRTQAIPTQGATATQRTSRAKLRRLTQRAGRLLEHHADQSGDTGLSGEARVNDLVLRQGSLDEVLGEAQRIEALVKEHPAAFAGNFKEPDFAMTLAAGIAAFQAVMGQPRFVIVTRAAATAQMKKTLRRGERLLLKLDAVVEQFEDEDPAFVTTWKHALKGRTPQPQTETQPEAATLAPTPEVKAA